MDYNYYECGNGWLPIINDAILIVDNWNLEHFGKDTNELLQFVQIKEKFGKLCLYLNYYPDEIENQIHELENQSLEICEGCGTIENVTTEQTRGWIYTLCPKCREYIK